MRETIKKILREDRSFKTPKFDYIRQVAKMIAYNDIELDINERTIVMPYLGFIRLELNGNEYVVYYVDEYMYVPELQTLAYEQYGLDIKGKEGMIKGLHKIIMQYLEEREKNEKHK